MLGFIDAMTASVIIENSVDDILACSTQVDEVV